MAVIVPRLDEFDLRVVLRNQGLAIVTRIIINYDDFYLGIARMRKNALQAVFHQPIHFVVEDDDGNVRLGGHNGVVARTVIGEKYR